MSIELKFKLSMVEEVDPLEIPLTYLFDRRFEIGSGPRSILRASLLDPIDTRVQGIVAIWEKVALEKERLSQSREKEQFSDCVTALTLISAGLRSKSPFFQMYICRDIHDQPMGFMRVYDHNDAALEVVALVTNPENIRSKLNVESRVAGAGSCLIEKVEEIAKERKKKFIQLDSLSNPEGFYHKKGFVFETGSRSSTMVKYI